MKVDSKVGLLLRLVLAALLLIPPGTLQAQQDKIAAFKQALAQNQKRLGQYEWTETTIIKMKGEEKSRVQKHCFYGPDGKAQKQQISAPPQQQSPGGLKGKVAAKKKGEITEYMKQAAELIHSYVPTAAERIQAARDADKLSFSPMGQSAVRLNFQDFVKPGDSMSLNVDKGRYALQGISIKSYLEKKDDAIDLDVSFAALSDGVNYPAQIVLNAPAKKIQVVVQNSNYQKMAAVEITQTPPQQPQEQQGPALSPQQIDTLTASIALYPDALLAQIFVASTNFIELQSFSGWMAKNAKLTGSELQDAAYKEGWDASLVALAPFPQVIQMMIEKPDWTKQLGQAFTANRNGVFDSIQRLRAQAQAKGNLKTNQQQEVATQTTSSGQQVIVIQPANPQVVYVPQYNPQVVYVQSAPPPSSSAAGAAIVGFTAGIIIGAAASNNYYHGPYGWHGGAMYNEYWEDRYDAMEDLQENRQDYMNDRQENYQQNQSERQSNSQANQANRQSASQANQAQRQSSAQGAQANSQANQANRQSSAQGAQAGRAQQPSTSQASQANRQAGVSAASTSSRSSGQAASQQRGDSSGGLSGYQSGSATKSQSKRGSRSLSSSRSSKSSDSSGGGRRRK
jgi:hypothetical protein